MNKMFNITQNQIEDCMSKHMTYEQMGKLFGCSKWTVMEKARQYGLRSAARKFQQLENNVAKQPKVKEKISDTVAKRWEDGCYEERINGMCGVRGFNHPNFEGGKWQFREKAIFYHGHKCMICGEELKKIDVHHVDENHDNWALTNLEPLCVKCHQHYHYANIKLPYMTVTKMFDFEAGHYIPEHPAKCKFLHGHSYKVEVTVRRRLNPITGMVMDFKQLSKAVKNNIIEIFDHEYLNDFIPNPTSENIVLWIWEKLSLDVKGIQRIRLYETASSYTEVTIDDIKQFISQCAFETKWLDDDKLLKDTRAFESYIKSVKEESK